MEALYLLKSSISTSRFLTLVFAPLLLFSFGMISHNAFAMGPPPGSCTNEYNAYFTNATITNGNQTYYPMKNNVSFQVTIGQSYYLTDAIKIANQSNQGNSQPGTFWFDTNVIGYPQSQCSGTVNPNQNVTGGGSFGFPQDYNPNQSQNIPVSFGVTNAFSYNVYWVTPKSTSAAPQNLQTTAGNSQISLSWSAPSSNGGSAITNYKIYRGVSSSNETLLTQMGNVTLYNDTTVTNSQTYFYKVTAVNSVGESPQSNEASATPTAPTTAPDTPTGLAATTVSSSQINLSWTAPANNGGSPITGYMIERSTDGGTMWSTLVANTGSTSTTYSDTGLTANTTYTYRVSAINAVGTSSPSNTSSATTQSASADQVVATIPVGSYPFSIAVNPNTNRIYVSDGNGIEVIDGTTNAVIDSISAAARQIAINTNTNLIYALVGTQTVDVINGSTNQVITSIGTSANTQYIMVNSITNKIYVSWTNWYANCPAGGIQIINGTTNTVSKSIGIGCGHPLLDGAVNPSTNKVYVFDQSGPIEIIDGNIDNFTGTISGGTNGNQMVINPTTDLLYVKGSNSIQTVDLSTNTMIGSTSVGSNLSTIGINPATNKIYVGDWNSDGKGTSVYVLDGSSNAVTQNLTVGSGPSAIGTNPNTNRIYVSAQVSNTVSVIDGNSSNTFTIPSSPQNLQATAGNAQVSLSWATPSSNGGSAITNYKIYRSTSSGTETLLTTVGNVNSYNDTTVTNSQAYFYKVTAVNSIGESSQSNEANATPTSPATVPTAPTGLTASTASSSQINLSWTAPSSNGDSPITGYEIQRSTDSGTTWSTIVSNTSTTNAKYNDTGLSPNTNYTYQISAINSVGTSAPSNTASATTNGITPSGIVVYNTQSTSGTVSSSPYQSTISNFNAGTGTNRLLVVGVSANNNNVASITFGGVSLTKKVSSFSNNDAEFWYLKNPSGTGNIVVTMTGATSAVVGAYSFSGVDQTTPIPTSTTNHNTAASSPAISITTKYANDFVLDLPSIYGGVKLSSPTCTQQWDVNMPSAVTGASSSKMIPSPSSVTCSWTASSGDQWDDTAIEVKASGTGSTTTVPGAPTGLTSTSISTSQINLSWTAPANNGGSAITGYMIERSTDSGTTWSTISSNTASTSTTYSDTGLSSSTTYTYRVSAINAVGTSSPSNTTSATTSGNTATVPQPPTGLAASAISSSGINLSWTAPSNNGGSAITGYQIERSPDGTTWSIIVSNTGSTSTAYSDTGLSPSTTYTYRVSAINSVGTSVSSNTASATTSATTTTTGIALGNTQSTSGTVSSSNQITISSFNVGSDSNRFLVVGVSANNNNVASITFGGVSLKNIANSFYNNDAEFWYLKNPSGTGDITVTMNGPTQAVVGAYAFSGVNQTLPIPTHVTKHNTSASSPNISLTTKYANDWVLDLPSIYGGSKLGTPTCTQQWDANIPSAITGASSSAMVKSPGATTCGWTASSADLYDDAAVEINAAR